MPFVPATNVVSAQMVYTQQGQFVENVYHVQFPAAPTPSTMNTVAAAFVSWFNVTQKTTVNVNVNLVKVLMTDLSSVNAGGVEYTTGLPIAGASAGTESPMNVTVAIKFLTGFRGRSYRGRIYHVGLVEGSYSGSTLGAGSLTTLKTTYDTLRTNIAGLAGGYGLVVLSRRENKNWRINAVATLITAVDVDATLDSQRRRLPGRGR